MIPSADFISSPSLSGSLSAVVAFTCVLLGTAPPHVAVSLQSLLSRHGSKKFLIIGTMIKQHVLND